MKLYQHESIRANPFDSIRFLRNDAKDAAGYDVSVPVIWLVTERHGWSDEKVHFVSQTVTHSAVRCIICAQT